MMDIEMTHPALIKLCLDCKRSECSGSCANFTEHLELVKRLDHRNRRPRGELYEYKGELHSIKDWCDIYGLPYWKVQQRVSRGWSIKDAIEVPDGARRRDQHESTDDNREPDTGSGEA